jgi:hypothetical protein
VRGGGEIRTAGYCWSPLPVAIPRHHEAREGEGGERGEGADAPCSSLPVARLPLEPPSATATTTTSRLSRRMRKEQEIGFGTYVR